MGESHRFRSSVLGAEINRASTQPGQSMEHPLTAQAVSGDADRRKDAGHEEGGPA